MGNAVIESEVSELLARVTRQVRETIVREGGGQDNGSSSGPVESVLLASAARYCPPAGDFAVTPPTGFDFEAGYLFEAIIESAFLVANADGTFDATEREAFIDVVLEASGRRVMLCQIDAIVSDLTMQLETDGFDKRVLRLATGIPNHVHRREALLIAALLACVSGGVSSRERKVLEQLAGAFDLPPTMVDEVLGEVSRSLSA